ncbi:MAG TPA: hypothetical protein V6C65_01795, partial [Allocoleopsis sp.]
VGVSERLAVAGIVGLPVLGNEHPASPYCTPYCFYFQYALPSITGLIIFQLVQSWQAAQSSV